VRSQSFHQPPAPFTYEELNRDFHDTVDAFIGNHHKEEVPNQSAWFPMLSPA
jgi:hypothetical protein